MTYSTRRKLVLSRQSIRIEDSIDYSIVDSMRTPRIMRPSRQNLRCSSHCSDVKKPGKSLVEGWTDGGQISGQDSSRGKEGAEKPECLGLPYS